MGKGREKIRQGDGVRDTGRDDWNQEIFRKKCGNYLESMKMTLSKTPSRVNMAPETAIVCNQQNRPVVRLGH